MSATDELRRMLDERGVAHSDHYLSTTWRDGHGILHLAGEPMADGLLVVDMLTPEQAIAATLGGGTLTAEQVREAIFGNSSYASYDGARYYADGIGMQAVADELNTRAERTCHVVKSSRKYVMSDGTELFDDGCSECNGYIGDGDNFCSNCGARVVEE